MVKNCDHRKKAQAMGMQNRQEKCLQSQLEKLFEYWKNIGFVFKHPNRSECNITSRRTEWKIKTWVEPEENNFLSAQGNHFLKLENKFWNYS